jgi:hypothetical protein
LADELQTGSPNQAASGEVAPRAGGADRATSEPVEGPGGHGVSTRPTSATSDVGDEFRPVRKRLAVFGSVILSTIIDLAFLGIWTAMHAAADIGFDYLGHLPGMEGLATEVLRYCFFFATLLPVLVYVARDMVDSSKRLWRA